MTTGRPRDPFLPEAPAWFAHRVGGERRLGVVLPDADQPLRDLGPFDDVRALASDQLSAASLRTHGADAPTLDDVTFDVPVARPSKILCFGKNFAAHAAEFGHAVPDEPLFFNKLPETLLPHDGTVVLPHWVDTRIDHEIELAVILGFDDPGGIGAKHVAPANAMDLVAGYTVLNDVTARRMQGDDRGAQKPWLRCKSFDTFCPIGPWVLAGSQHDLADREIAIHVNDELRQRSRLGLMVVDVPTGIAWLSKHTTLRPGDIIAMGTPEGVGPIGDGDRMTGWIDGIGVLNNPVVREPVPGA